MFSYTHKGLRRIVIVIYDLLLNLPIGRETGATMATRGEQDPYDKTPVVLLRTKAGISHPRPMCTAMYFLYSHVRPCTCSTAMYGYIRLLVVPLLWEAGHVEVHWFSFEDDHHDD